MKLFLEKTGTDMERIRQELEKLICYCMEKESITEEDVAVICSEQTENKIFDMINAMAEKKQKKAMELYYAGIKRTADAYSLSDHTPV